MPADDDSGYLRREWSRYVAQYERGIMGLDELTQRLIHTDGEGVTWEQLSQFVLASTLSDEAKRATLDYFDSHRAHMRQHHESMLELQNIREELDADPTNAELRTRVEDQMLTWLRDGIPGDLGGRLVDTMTNIATTFELRRVFEEGAVIVRNSVPSEFARYPVIFEREARRYTAQNVWEEEARKDAASIDETTAAPDASDEPNVTGSSTEVLQERQDLPKPQAPNRE